MSADAITQPNITIATSSIVPTPSATRVESVSITSFGPFLDVTLNPSQAVAELVTSALEKLLRGTGAAVSHEAGITVSATAVSEYLCKLRDDILKVNSTFGSSDDDDGGINFLFHFGVHNSSPTINVELTGKNCAAFRGPDAEGFQCTSAPLVAAETPSDARQFFPKDMCAAWIPFVKVGDAYGILQTTSLAEDSVQSIVDNTNAELVPAADTTKPTAHPPVKLAVSNHAGLYLCNYVYFGSLALSCEANALIAATSKATGNEKRRRYVSLFIHVVNTDLMPADQQAVLCTAFLVKLMSLCCHGTTTA